MSSEPKPDWRAHGVKIVPSSQLDLNTPQTPGMARAAAITHARTGAGKLWAGTVNINANAKTGAHHHGELESVIYVVNGRARMRWGEHLEFVAEAGPGDFIYVPPFVPHQEINASTSEVLSCVGRSTASASLIATQSFRCRTGKLLVRPNGLTYAARSEQKKLRYGGSCCNRGYISLFIL
jgi:uncharacterized RmlC-like cupin family protein